MSGSKEYWIGVFVYVLWSNLMLFLSLNESSWLWFWFCNISCVGGICPSLFFFLIFVFTFVTFSFFLHTFITFYFGFLKCFSSSFCIFFSHILLLLLLIFFFYWLTFRSRVSSVFVGGVAPNCVKNRYPLYTFYSLLHWTK